jgi:hypothetical protein
MVTVKYYNGLNPNPELTLRTFRKLVKLWDIDDVHLADDDAEIQRKFGPIPVNEPEDNSTDVDVNVGFDSSEQLRVDDTRDLAVAETLDVNEPEDKMSMMGLTVLNSWGLMLPET